MTIEIRNGTDLFSLSKTHILCHCISADFALGAGIARMFEYRLGTKTELQKSYGPHYLRYWNNSGMAYDCLTTKHVYNLVTKEKYFNKPTYESIRGALAMMASHARLHCVSKVAMPLIGCGLDRLDWDKVLEIITDVFAIVDIDIVVCTL